MSKANFSKPVKIYWSSNHLPLPIQLKWLEERFGTIQVIMGKTGNAAEIVEDFRRQGCDEMVVVAPLWVIYHILKEGVKPLWANMEVIDDPAEADLEYRGRFYKFKGFRRISAIEIKYEEV